MVFGVLGRARSAACIAVVTLAGMAVCGPVAAADPNSSGLASVSEVKAAAEKAPNGSNLREAEEHSDRQLNLTVHSAAMDKDITVRVVRPKPETAKKGPQSTVYMLGGVEGNSEKYGWEQMTDVEDFFADKNVNLVIPFGGESSYYTDWQQDDPELGRNKWKTFLTEELPPIVDSAFETTKKNVLIGLSMSTTAVLNLAIAAPDLYEGVGAYSGCAMTSDPVARRFVEITVSDFGGNPVNMWGGPDDPMWVRNDPYVNAEKLRGTALYISSGTGLPGEFDRIDAPKVAGNQQTLATRVVVGGILEAVTNECTTRMADKLSGLDIPATVNLRPNGTHVWEYWQQDLHDSWPILARSLED
ncbi:alpha/beta hydrolase [Rhodococcus sp. NPDC058521]|uniref:alpha/beta hydrolase n=1 Tax=Rhodococcus sp. NPDC058521 TaxID=3346536 RepID=UPI0036623503